MYEPGEDEDGEEAIRAGHLSKCCEESRGYLDFVCAFEHPWRVHAGFS